jgi:dipeptidyl aminopeptidase/acylaminoacyl peptidase
VYAPDGERLAFVCRSRGDVDDGICIMDADGSNISTLVDDPDQGENHPAWGPVGNS